MGLIVGMIQYFAKIHAVYSINFIPPDIQIRQEEERRLQEEWDRRRVAEARAGLILETQIMKKKRELRHQAADDNKLLAKEQNAE